MTLACKEHKMKTLNILAILSVLLVSGCIIAPYGGHGGGYRGGYGGGYHGDYHGGYGRR